VRVERNQQTPQKTIVAVAFASPNLAAFGGHDQDMRVLNSLSIEEKESQQPVFCDGDELHKLTVREISHSSCLKTPLPRTER
jgi:hypothetical protein